MCFLFLFPQSKFPAFNPVVTPVENFPLGFSDATVLSVMMRSSVLFSLAVSFAMFGFGKKKGVEEGIRIAFARSFFSFPLLKSAAKWG